MPIPNGTLYTFQRSDWIKGLAIAIGGVLLPSLYDLIDNGALPTWVEFAPVLKAAIGAGITYVGKNFLSNSDGKFMKKETPVLPYTEPKA